LELLNWLDIGGSRLDNFSGWLSRLESVRRPDDFLFLGPQLLFLEPLEPLLPGLVGIMVTETLDHLGLSHNALLVICLLIQIYLHVDCTFQFVYLTFLFFLFYLHFEVPLWLFLFRFALL